MEIIVVIVVTGVLVPLVMWLADESAGRARWARVARSVEEVSLGLGAFRGSTARVEHVEVLRTRAPWWVRGLALTCYLPVGVAVVAALPWFLGCLYATERSHHMDLERAANSLLVVVYPFGCWAAARMWSLGRALLAGSAAGFREALGRAAWVELPLNLLIVFMAVMLAASYRKADALWLAVAPMITLAQLAAVALAGARTLSDDESEAPAPQTDVNGVSLESA